MAGGNVDRHDLVHQDLRVGVLAEDGANGLGDVGRGEDGERDLVEERLKDVVVAAVHDRYVDGEFGQAFCRIDAGKAAADDDDARTDVSERFGESGQGVPPLYERCGKGGGSGSGNGIGPRCRNEALESGLKFAGAGYVFDCFEREPRQ